MTQKRDEGAADDVPDSSQLAAEVPRKCGNTGRESERGELWRGRLVVGAAGIPVFHAAHFEPDI